MANFIQLHMLTSYPPANLNRDDLGRPKTALYGGTQRLRVSSQCLKRAARLSPAMEQAVSGGLGKRTLLFGESLRTGLEQQGTAADVAAKIAANVAHKLSPLVKDTKKKGLRSEVITFYAADEIARAHALCTKLAAEGRTEPSQDEIKEVATDALPSADVALFGRMIADKGSGLADVEGAAAVAHAISIHSVAIESDYFTAADDLQDRDENAGAGHVSETGFAAAVFYSWACIDWDLLVDNLDGDTDLASRTVEGFVSAMTSSGPGGKKRAFGSITRPRFVMIERGCEADNLSSAFLKPVTGDDVLEAGADHLEGYAARLSDAYDRDVQRMTFRATSSESPKLKSVIAFAAQPFPTHSARVAAE